MFEADDYHYICSVVSNPKRLTPLPPLFQGPSGRSGLPGLPGADGPPVSALITCIPSDTDIQAEI